MFLKKIQFLFVLVLFISNSLNAQDTYLVYLKNKTKEYSIDKPEQFLSKKSIDRRIKNNIKITEKDLPVNTQYIKQIKATGVEIIGSSRWLNCVFIKNNKKSIQEIDQFSFVQKVEKYHGLKAKPEKISNRTLNYGDATVQTEMLKGDVIHNLGYTGSGVVIAIFDDGFYQVDNIGAFSHLYSNSKVLSTHNYCGYEFNTVYDAGSHGTSVLSCMAANETGEMIGTAPDASYRLFLAWNASSTADDEIGWVLSAEEADVLGVDIIQSSLYFTAGEAPGEDSYTYEDMDGQTALSTQAAQSAYEAGIVVLNCAGNLRAESWHYIGAPADAEGVLAVGAVDGSEDLAYFSSAGPSFDGRIKPDITAMGYECYVINTNGNTEAAYGTSFSTPITSGLVACLIQAFPSATAEEIRTAIVESADRYNNPDNDYGYGIPDFEIAYNNLLASKTEEIKQSDSSFSIYPNPFSDFINISASSVIKNITIYDVSGRAILCKMVNNSDKYVLDINKLGKAFYYIKVECENDTYIQKIIRE